MSNIRRKKSVQFGSNSHSPRVRNAPTSIQSPPSDLQNTSLRLAGIWIALGLGTLGLITRLIWLQIFQAPKLKQEAQRRQSTIARPFVPRRTIIDRSNRPIAIDQPSYTIYAHPNQFREIITGKGLRKNGINKVRLTRLDMAQRLAPILNSTAEELNNKFKDRHTGVKIGSDFQEEIVNRIKKLRLEGIEISQGELDYTRFYPQGDTVAEILGYLDWEHKAQAGVELSQSLLLERKVVKYRLTKTGGNNGSILSDRVTPGYLHTDDLSLRLTVDLRLQLAAKQALREKMQEWNAPQGTVIVMDAETGALRALVVEPTYDPNHYARDVQEYSKKVGKDRATSLLRNSAVSDLYEPGSTFKPIAVAIALENKIIQPHTTFFDPGSIKSGIETIRNSDKKGHGNINIAEILQYSSNVGMVKMMRRLTPDVYYGWLQRIGLGKTSRIDLPAEERGQVVSQQEFVSKEISRDNAAFGQGFSLTPIQMVRLLGSIANGGKLVTPHVVEGLFDSDGVRKDKPDLQEPSQIFSAANTQTVLEMMETVVTKGSGAKAQIPGYRIAGKTGTSQKAGKGGYKSDDRKITSFVGILPVDGQRRYVVFAAIDEPKGKERAFGSNVAAPVVKSVMESLIAIDGIAPSNPAELQKYKDDLLRKDKTEPDQKDQTTIRNQ